MMFNVENTGKITVVALNVESLDAGNATVFKSEIRPVIEGKRKVVLEISKLDFVDSSGLGAILSSLRTVNSNDGELVLCGMTKPVRALFELVRMHRIVDVFNTKEEAINSFKGD